MVSEFKKCLKNKKIIKFAKAKKKIKIEIKAAKEDFKNAKSFLRDKNFKYATIAGYYSLFHSARALLYSRGYREKSHYCLRIAIKELFVKEKLIDPEYLDLFDEAMGLREAADYESLYSKKGAKQAINGAEKFLAATLKILA